MVFERRRYGFIKAAAIIATALSLLAAIGSVRFARDASAPVFANFWPHVSDASNTYAASLVDERRSLKGMLKSAANENNTIIISILNEAWSSSGLLFDLFIESFTIGEDTKVLLDHLVVVTLDQQAFEKCNQVHKYCYAHFTQGENFHREAFYMTPSYIKLVWVRLNFMITVLEMGYNLVFTDTDILWLKNPFLFFDNEADTQVSCDRFIGRPYDLRNEPNVGFQYVRSNKHTKEFFKFWYKTGKEYPDFKLQDVLNIIRFDTSILSIGIKIKFFNTTNFAGLCSPEHVDLNLAYTVHANCCVGLNNKVRTLKFLVQQWRYITSFPVDQRGKISKELQLNHPYKCRYMHHGQRIYASHQEAKMRQKIES